MPSSGPDGRLQIWGFEPSSNSIVSPTAPRHLPEPSQVKRWLGKDHFTGYLRLEGRILDFSPDHKRTEPIYRDAIASGNGEVLTIRKRLGDPPSDLDGTAVVDWLKASSRSASSDNLQVEVWDSFDRVGTDSPSRTFSLPASLVLIDLAAGGSHFVLHCYDVASSCQVVYTLGDNRFGQLGLGRSNTSPCVSTPTPVTTLASLAVVSVACGDTHTVALCRGKENKSVLQVFVFGSDREGQCGGVSGELGADPTTVDDFTEDELGAPYAIACGGNHTVVLTSKGVAVSGSSAFFSTPTLAMAILSRLLRRPRWPMRA